MRASTLVLCILIAGFIGVAGFAWNSVHRHQEFVFSEEDLQIAVNKRLQSTSDQEGILVSEMHLHVNDTDMQIAMKLRGTYLGKNVLLSADVRGTPTYSAFLGAFRFHPTSVVLTDVSSQQGAVIGTSEESKVRGTGNTEDSIRRSIENAVEHTFEQVHGHELTEGIKQWTWLNTAEVKDGKVIVSYSFLQTTTTFLISIAVLCIIAMLIAAVWYDPTILLWILLIGSN